MEVLNWYAIENGMGNYIEEAHKLVKLFSRSYIYIKGYERDYGNQLKALCKEIQRKYLNITAPLIITDIEERKTFGQKLSER